MRVAYLKKKLQHKIISTRVSARELLGDYDPHLNGGTVRAPPPPARRFPLAVSAVQCSSPLLLSMSHGVARLAGMRGGTWRKGRDVSN